VFLLKKVCLFLLGTLVLTGCSGVSSSQPESDSTKQSTVVTSTTTLSSSATTSSTTNDSLSTSTSTSLATENNQVEASQSETSDTAATEDYYQAILDAWQEEEDYINSLTDDKEKQSVQTAFGAANAKATQLELEHPEDAEQIKEALTKVLNGQ
jgi:hypothetical protein